MSIYGKGIRGKATKLHARVIRQRGACQRCGSTNTLQCAHIISRHYAATRCDPANAFCLCAGCHRWAHNWPVEMGQWIIDQIGADAYDDLRAKAMAGVKTNDVYWQEQIDVLTPMLKDAA